MSSKTKLLFLLFSSLAGMRAFAAACCGGGFAAPALIVGDDRAQVTMSYGYSRVLSDVDSSSLWHNRAEKESSETYKIEAAHIFYDQWQAGISAPAVRRARDGESEFGLGDVATTLGY